MCGLNVTINGTAEEVVLMGEHTKHRGYPMRGNLTQLDNIKVYFNWLPIVNDNAPQPALAAQWTVWLNGYISNYKEIAKKHDITLSVDSDTLLLAEFIAKFSLTRLDELNGFFAVVAYNGVTRQVHTFTDRYGIKQLYSYNQGGRVYISSEVKGIQAIANLELDPEAVEDWKYSLGVMTPNTIYKGVTRVPSLPLPIPQIIDIEYEEAKEELKRLFEQSCERNKTEHSGVFLSGGIDSGIIAKYIKPEYSFSIDYENELSEYENIKLNSTGIHHIMLCNNAFFECYAKKTFKALDDLKAGSCYTNFALAELASRYCRVVYSGAGGDELFYGYTHRYNKPINQVIARTGSPMKEYNITHEEYNWLFLRSVLVVEDRMGGFHTMETRYPLLDNDFVNFALSLPVGYRHNKKILKDISGLDTKVLIAPKRGFTNPHFTNKTWTEFALNEVNNSHNSILRD